VNQKASAIEIEGNTIKAIIGPGQPRPPCDNTYDAKGQMVMPGFIDQHIHGANGADVTDCTDTSIEIVAEAKVREGVTTFLPTTVTMPQEAILKTMRSVKAYSENPTFAKTPAVHIEGPFINEKYMGAQNPEFLREPNMAEVSEANTIYPVGLVSLAIEVKNSSTRTKWGSCFHSPTSPPKQSRA